MMRTDKTEEETREDSIQVMPHEGRGKKKHEEAHCSGVRALERSL